MKFYKSLLIAVMISAFAQISFAQQRMNGKVVDVINGKTIVVELSVGKKITAVLEFIEIPEAEQPLSQIVAEHLKKLVLGKNVEVSAKTIMPTFVIGSVFLGEINISQQMLRDGAGWYPILEKDRQDEFESRNFQLVEAQAKLEKRGVWGIENIKPAWEFRAEKEELRRQKEQFSLINSTKDPVESAAPPKEIVNASFPDWIRNDGRNFDSINKIGNLMVGYSSENQVGFVTTPQFNFEIADQKKAQGVRVSVSYFYKENGRKGKESYYLVGVESDTNDFKFLSTDHLLITADGQKVNIGRAQKVLRNENSVLKEILTYKISRAIVDKVAYSSRVEFRVGTYSGKLDSSLQNLIKPLLNAAH